MVLTILVASICVMPRYSTAQPTTNQVPDDLGLGQIRRFGAGFGSLLGGLGYGGRLLGEVFGTLFMQGLDNLSKFEVIQNTFVMSASRERNITRTHYADNEEEIYYVPYEYYGEGHDFQNDGYAYVKVKKSGSYTYTRTLGAAVTLVVWDNDRSFVNAAKRLIEFFNKLRTYEQQGTIEEHQDELISEGSEIITWFLIHINDIFTGDELFVLNPITYQNLYIDRSNYSVEKSYHYTGSDYEAGGGDDKYIGDSDLNSWRNDADEEKDTYTQWILEPTINYDNKIRKYTQFTFDLMQLWVKNFHIEIDVGELISQFTGEGGNPAKAFQGCNIDFFFFTHSLAGAFLFNDKNLDNEITVNYTTVEENGEPVTTNGTVAKVPQSSELTHQLILRNIGDFDFQEPSVDKQEKSVSWGLQMNDVGISGVPIGIDLAEYEKDPAVNELDYMYFGFTFEPKLSEQLLAADNSTVIRAAQGMVKLDQFFAPWNGGTPPASGSEFDGLDMSVIYVSTVLHFLLDIQTEDLSQEDTTPDQLANQTEYDEKSHKLSIGNYLDPEIEAQLPFVDMAGPGYDYGTETSKTTANVSTSIMPTALWEGQQNQYEIFSGDEETTTDDFGADIRLSIDFNIMLYGINYPQFNGYNGIWHDPTFSVYMIFESQGFWALILLIAGVSLVGVATVLLKRRKEAQINF